jgi:hypothetical protein
LNFWQAQDRARVLARGGMNEDANNEKLVNVKQALERYETDLRTRGGDPANATRFRIHLSDYLIVRRQVF